ncbi:diaminopropionate ammonia-lyase [uncultured Shewanella sp.]|uniref:diaminopropionate ammonia-lyase n=1 Tax=uncultured Shewanella sp. TaxID=173975 RepID=UPI0026334BB5|nr:diaminopropionate ammonia-lyase [uncultured Shewanella sp.]
MLLSNEAVKRCDYPSQLKSILNMKAVENSRRLLASWEYITPFTPIWSLPQLADALGVAQVSVKDESKRSRLGSFKVLGAPNALVQLVQRCFPSCISEDILTGRYAELLKTFTVISATDGNHGCSLAAAAQSIGCLCVIVIHANVSQERENAISECGATVIRTDGNYDQSVEEAQQLAQDNHWHVVSDTSYEGYELIPADVMQGYGILSAEVVEQLKSSPLVTHVFIQGGVGGLAAGVISYLWEFYQTERPFFILVEPEQADCLYQSATHRKASEATGRVDSLMAGLACGKTSPLAWQFLASSVDYFMLIKDEDAKKAMRCLAAGGEQDIPIVAGESGAAGVAGLMVLDEYQKQSLNIDECSHVLFFNTEGATAPNIYRGIIGEDDKCIVSHQESWLERYS